VRVLEQVQHIAPPVQAGANWGSVGAAILSFFGVIQGPIAVIASVLSAAWLGCQLWLFFTNKPWRKK
jgi:hypothetical protein